MGSFRNPIRSKILQPIGVIFTCMKIPKKCWIFNHEQENTFPKSKQKQAAKDATSLVLQLGGGGWFQAIWKNLNLWNHLVVDACSEQKCQSFSNSWRFYLPIKHRTSLETQMSNRKCIYKWRMFDDQNKTVSEVETSDTSTRAWVPIGSANIFLRLDSSKFNLRQHTYKPP